MSKYLRKQRITEAAKITGVPQSDIENFVTLLQKDVIIPPMTDNEIKQQFDEWGKFFREYKEQAELLDKKDPAYSQKVMGILKGLTLPSITKLMDDKIIRQKKTSGKYLGINDTSSPLFKSRICPKCHHLFIGNTKYCSHRCYLDSRYSRREKPEVIVYKNCIVCGKPMNKKAGAMVCSSACQKKK